MSSRTDESGYTETELLEETTLELYSMDFEGGSSGLLQGISAEHNIYSIKLWKEMFTHIPLDLIESKSVNDTVMEILHLSPGTIINLILFYIC